jgi:hypothetical protein
MRTDSRLRDWQERLREPSLSVVLALEALLMFVIGPTAETGILFPRAIPGFVLLIALLSIFMVAQGSAARGLLLAAFLATLACTALRTAFPSRASFMIVETIAILLFIAAVVGVMARAAFTGGRVTVHRIQGAIAIYLNIALAFAFLDNLILTRWPDAYLNIAPAGRDHLGEMIYFSLTTLTTTGYGDLAPFRPVARGVANLEAVIGQLYPATMIAALVGLHVSHRQQADTKSGRGE